MKVSYFLSGFALGALVVGVLLARQPIPQPSIPVAVDVEDTGCKVDLAAARGENAELKQRLAAIRSERLTQTISPPTPLLEQQPQQEVTGAANEAVRWKLSSIEKFVSLSDDQRNRLRDKFERESAVPSGETPDTESLEDIIGVDSARFYREQVAAAFKRVQIEELEREVVWLSRRLVLSPEQERQMRTVFEAVEQQINGEQRAEGQHASTPAERVKLMIAENRRRSELRNEQVKSLLSPEQYEAYSREQAESSASDIEVYHE